MTIIGNACTNSTIYLHITKGVALLMLSSARAEQGEDLISLRQLMHKSFLNHRNKQVVSNISEPLKRAACANSLYKYLFASLTNFPAEGIKFQRTLKYMNINIGLLDLWSIRLLYFFHDFDLEIGLSRINCMIISVWKCVESRLFDKNVIHRNYNIFVICFFKSNAI